MDDVTQAGEAVETSPAVEGQEEQEVVAQDEATDEVAPEEGQTDETPAVSDETDPDIVKDDTGAEFIPKKVFEARLAKLTAQKHNAVEEFLAAAQSDPAVAEQLRQTLGVQSSAKTDETANGDVAPNLPVLSWLDKNKIAPELRPHYIEWADVMGQTLMPQLQAMVEERLSPMLSYIGKQEVSSFTRANPDAKAMMPQLQQMVSSGRARTLADAYVLHTHAAKLKGAGVAAVRSEKARQAKLVSTPIKRGAGSPGQTQRKPENFRDMLEMTAREKGFSVK